MEVYNDTICLTGSEITKVIPKGTLDSLCHRRLVDHVRRACNGTPALFAIESFPKAHREKLYEAYSELSDEKERKKRIETRRLLLNAIVADPIAMAFFQNYQTPRGESLSKEKQDELYHNAIILNGCRRVYEKSLSEHIKSGHRKDMIKKCTYWQECASAMNGLQLEYRHSLPGSWLRLKEKYECYQRDGYKALLSGSFGNENRVKKNRKQIEQIILSIYGSKEKPFVSDVTKYYHEFVLGIREIYSVETGEIFNRNDFYHKGEPVTISDGLVWNIINDPLNRKVVDRLRNDFHYNQNKHNADVERKAPYFSLSKVSFDDRDLVRKAWVTRTNKVTGKTERHESQVHAYYAFDVASGVCIGSAYSLNKDTNLVMDCFRNMWVNLRTWGLAVPWEAEVENHLMKGTAIEDKLNETFMEVTFCAPMNSREKRAEHLIKQKKWYTPNSEVKRGSSNGRHYAKSEAYLHSREKVFDELNDTYKNSLETWEYARVVEEDQSQMHAWHNELHPAVDDKKTKTKTYPGLTRMGVLMTKQNKNCAPLNWRNLCHTWGKTTKTSVVRGKSCEVDYRRWWLSSPEVITRFNPNNTECFAYYIPNAEGLVEEIYLYQDERFIDKPQYMGAFNEAKGEQTEKDIEIMHRQLGWIQQAKTLAKTKKEEVIIPKVVMVKSEVLNRAADVVLDSWDCCDKWDTCDDEDMKDEYYFDAEYELADAISSL
jgi:hypothetical protein